MKECKKLIGRAIMHAIRSSFQKSVLTPNTPITPVGIAWGSRPGNNPGEGRPVRCRFPGGGGCTPQGFTTCSGSDPLSVASGAVRHPVALALRPAAAPMIRPPCRLLWPHSPSNPICMCAMCGWLVGDHCVGIAHGGSSQ